jgi:hypothetical protein
VKNTVNKHGILPGDTYNSDENGFQMGHISASKLVTAIDKPGRPMQMKPTNTEWVTLIKGAWLSNPTFHHHERERVQPGLVLSGPPLNMDILSQCEWLDYQPDWPSMNSAL